MNPAEPRSVEATTPLKGGWRRLGHSVCQEEGVGPASGAKRPPVLAEHVLPGQPRGRVAAADVVPATAPRIRRGLARQASPNRVEVDVAAQLPAVRRALDQDGLETPLEQVPRPAVAAVERRSEAGIQIVHPWGQVRLRRLQEQVKMVGHQRPGKHSPATPRRHAVEQLQPLRPVRVVPHDRAPLQPAARHMVHPARNIHS